MSVGPSHPTETHAGPALERENPETILTSRSAGSVRGCETSSFLITSMRGMINYTLSASRTQPAARDVGMFSGFRVVREF